MKNLFKKSIASFMVVVMLLTATPLSGFIGLDIPESLNVSIEAEAATADDIISTARSQKGAYGSDINKFTTWFYGKSTNAAWCAIFVSWCANQVGVLNNAIPKNANCASMMAWFKNRGEYYSVNSNYVPQKGDIIFFDTDGSGVTHHVEFVAQSGFITENGKTKVKCIGGNTSNSSFNGSDYVAEKNRYIHQSSCKVMGYAHPSYGSTNDYSSNTYSFSFNANGGTLGSSGAFNVKYGEQFQVLNTTCTRSGYTWAGWNVKRNNDNKWYVDGQGWCTESEINNNGYIKRVYPNYKTLTFDNSWTSGMDGNLSYTFYAIWIQQRNTELRIFMSPYGRDYDHVTALNNATGTGFTQERIYAWYILYDTNTGDLLNTYADWDYSVELEIYDPSGQSVHSYNYTDSSDANWIGISPQMSGKYTATATFTRGDTVVNVNTSYIVSYDADLIASHDSVELNLNGVNSQTVTINVGGAYPGKYNIRRKLSNSNVSTSWGSYSGNSCTLNVTGNTVGKTDITIELFEEYTGNKNVIATITIPVNVTANAYSVKYNANGGSGSMSNSSHTYSVAKELTSNAFTRTGYTFIGWSTNSSATSATYTNKQSVTNLTSSNGATVNLYAIWKANTYTVKYNSNGGTGSMSDSSHTYDTSKALSSNAFSRTGYTFLGWSTSSSSTSATYTNNQSVKNLTSTNGGTVTLYAVWKANTYTVKYNANGGTGSMSDSSHTYNTSKALSSNAFSKNNYKFLGWSTSSSATTVTYTNGQSVKNLTSTNGGTVNLYAVWGYSDTTKPTVSISSTNNVATTQTVTLNMSDNAGVVSYYWGTSSSPANSSFTSITSATSKSVTKTVSEPGTYYLIAKDTAGNVSTATITFNKLTFNGNNGITPYEYVVFESGKLFMPLPTATREGYELLGWAKSSSATSAEYPADNLFGTNKSQTLYAVWKANTYTVKYNANGGTGSMSNSNHTYDTSKALASNAFSKTGYTFLGWATSSSATTATYTNGQSVKNLTSTNGGSVTLYAVWKANTYTVKYNANGGTGSMADSTHTYDTAKALSSNAFSKTSYTFLGWATSSSSTTVTYTNGQSVKNLTSTNGDTVNLYAVWGYNDTTKPSISISSTNDVATSQTVTIDLSDNVGVVSYYWGTSSSPASNSFTSITSATSKTFTVTASESGTYYLIAKDTAGNVATESYKFYKTTLNGNNGTVTPDYVLTKSGDSFTLPTATRTGYTFLGWSASSTATSATYSAGSSYKPTANATLYAVWQQNDATKPTVSISSTNNVTIKQTVTLTMSDDTGIVGYYWGTDKNPASSSFTSITSALIKTETKEVIDSGTYYLIAKDAAGNVSTTESMTFCMITFDINKGSVDPAYMIINNSSKIKLPEAKKEGLVFLGWATNKAATSADYPVGSTYNFEKDIILYPVWKTEKPDVILGDVNGDDVIDAGDAVIISRYDAGFITLTEDQLAAADVNNDGVVDAGDAVIISRYDAGFISSLK